MVDDFLINNNQDDLFIHLILSDDSEHSCLTKPCIILVLNCKTEKLYHFSISHQDDPVVALETIISDLSNFNGRLFVLDKKSFIQHIPINSVFDINLGLHLKHEKIINILEYETNAHKFIKQNCNSYSNLNKVIPLVKHREMVFNVFKHIKKFITNGIFKEDYYLKINTLIVESLSEIESNGIFVDVAKFNKYFASNIHNNLVYSQYNLYTSTLRPSNRFGGINYAALNKDDGCKECFVSRFGENGKMVLIDYSAFHPRIICELTNFKIGFEVDFYKYIAELFFNKTTIDDNDIKNAKLLTFRQLYGGVEKQYSHIRFFYNLKSFIDDHWNRFKKDGYIKTPIFGRKITENQIQEPNPSKLFNYILQATETEIAVPILGEVNNCLRNKLSKSILYTYDSILFDFCNEEFSLINDIINIMNIHNKYPIKCYSGNSYANLKQITI